jgi:WD40 repeat protein
MMYRSRKLKVLPVFAVMHCLSAGGHAQDATSKLSTEPILRIETGKHGGTIQRIDADAKNRFAVTASNDKTVRVWSLPEGRPIRVLRLPIDQGGIGKAYAVAISPDGTTVAVGGHTTGAPQNENIFLFDRASGELKQRLSGLPDVVHYLVYSPDGQHLAASLGGNNGIRAFDAGDGYRQLPSDAEYRGDSYSAAFDRSGRLVTASYDGSVRLYAADRYQTPIARFDAPGHQVHSVAVSPDGSMVAAGYFDTSDNVVVLSGADLKELFKPKTASGPRGAFDIVGWSEDGRFLYAGGFWTIDNVRQVRRWSDGGRGAFLDIPSASDTIMQIVPLKKMVARCLPHSATLG